MVLSLEEILLIESDFVPSLEFDRFFLERFPPMMFFLACHRSYRHQAVAAFAAHDASWQRVLGQARTPTRGYPPVPHSRRRRCVAD